MFGVMRVVVALGALLLLLVGLGIVALGGPAALSGAWLMVLGAAGLLGAAFERTRYRSEAAERNVERAAASDAEEGELEPRFRPTDERFVDPTTRAKLRVWVDAATGERRYRPDA